LTKESDSRKDNYSEWIWLSNDWVCIGTTSLELEDYVTEDEWDARITQYAKQSWVSANYQPKGDYLSANALDDYYNKSTIDQKIEDFITSAEADTRYQLKGDYATKQELTDKAEEISAWANGKFITSAALVPYAKTADVNEQFRLTSAWANGTFLTEQSIEPFKTASADWNEAYRLVSNFSGNWNEVSAKLDKTDFNAYSADIASALDNRYTKDNTSAADQLSEEFAKYAKTEDLEGLASEEWVEQNFISSAASANWDLQGYSGADGIKIENHIVSFSGDFVDEHELEEALKPYALTSAVSGFHNTVLSADETVDIDREILQDGTYKYTLHVEPGDVTQISAHRGISAEKNEETGEWVIGLSDAVVSFGRFYQMLNDGENYYNKSELYGDTIEYDTTTNEIYLNPGIFHIDTQVNIVVPANIYDDAVGNYTIQVAPKIGSTVLQRPTVTREVENTYQHTETIELSFDVKIDSRKKFGISVTGLPAGVRTDYEIQNINIHEQITSIAQLIGGAGTTYIDGEAISISPDTNSINVNAGGGLEIDQATNTLRVKAGNGLKIIESGALEGTLELNEVTEEVIQEVQKMESDLQTKVTVNFDYANIAGVTDFANQGSTTHSGVLLGFLFAVPINSTLYGPNDSQDYESVIGVYSKQVWDQSNIILGLYEYDPSYYNEQTHEWGRTVPKCDTGPVNLKQGLNEFTIKHFNNLGETDKELKSGCLYYAAIYVPVDSGSNILLASCPGYGQNNTFNAVPQLTLDQANIGGYLQTGHYIKGKDSWPNDMNDLSFNNFGWGSWAGDYNFHELPEVPRFFMQIRNRVKTV